VVRFNLRPPDFSRSALELRGPDAQAYTVARYGHAAGLFFTPRAPLKVDVRTSTASTFAGQLSRAHVEFYVRTWSEK